MADPSIVNPGASSYSIPDPTTTVVGSVPGMDMQRVLPRQTSTGLARGVQQLGSPNVYVDSGNEQVIVAKTDGGNVTTPQVLMGNQVNKGEGFYVTKPGIDVTTAKNDSDFIFNSNQDVFKIVSTGTVNSPAINLASPGAGNFASTTEYTTIEHNLGYIPASFGYLNVASTTWVLLPYSQSSGAGTGCNWWTVALQADSTTLYIQFGVTVFATSFVLAEGAFQINYYLLQESVS